MLKKIIAELLFPDLIEELNTTLETMNRLHTLIGHYEVDKKAMETEVKDLRVRALRNKQLEESVISLKERNQFLEKVKTHLSDTESTKLLDEVRVILKNRYLAMHNQAAMILDGLFEKPKYFKQMIDDAHGNLVKEIRWPVQGSSHEGTTRLQKSLSYNDKNRDMVEDLILKFTIPEQTFNIFYDRITLDRIINEQSTKETK